MRSLNACNCSAPSISCNLLLVPCVGVAQNSKARANLAGFRPWFHFWRALLVFSFVIRPSSLEPLGPLAEPSALGASAGRPRSPALAPSVSVLEISMRAPLSSHDRIRAPEPADPALRSRDRTRSKVTSEVKGQCGRPHFVVFFCG